VIESRLDPGRQAVGPTRRTSKTDDEAAQYTKHTRRRMSPASGSGGLVFATAG